MTTELRLLRYFVAVAETLNFTRAGEQLYIAQPSLSAAIRQLERQIGVKLFDRDTRRVALTPAGEALLPHAREALDAAHRGIHAAQAAAQEPIEVLRVLYTPPLEPVALDALDRLEAATPAVPVAARSVWAGELLRDLREGRADAGLVRFPDERTDLAFRALPGEAPCVLLAENHPLAGRQRLVLTEVADMPVVVWADELGLDQYNAYVADLCAAAGLTHRGYATRRLDVATWGPVGRNEAIAIVGATERTPGGTRKILVEDARPMPLLVAHRPAAPVAQIDALADAVAAALDACATARQA